MTAEIIDTVCKTLRLPTCTRRFPRDIGRARPCLNYHMGTCAGYCLKDVTRAEYLQGHPRGGDDPDGRTAELTAELTEQMQAAADALRFEYAASLRDRLRAIQGLQKPPARVIATAYSDTDAVGFQRGAKCCFTVLHFTDGNLTGKDKSFLDEPMEPDGEALAALVQQYYEGRGVYPRQVLLPCLLEGQDALERLLTEAAGHKVALAVPQRGDKCRLTEMAAKNAREEILIATTKAQRSLKTLEWLQRALELDAPPERIEAFDISNPRRYRHRRRYDRVPARAAAQVGLPEVPHPHDGRAERLRIHARGGHAPLSALCGRRPRAFARCRIYCSSTAAPSMHLSRRRCSTVLALSGAGVRHGQGRPPPHPRAHHARRA